MKLLGAACAIFCVLIVVNGAEEAADPPAKSGGLAVSEQEGPEHGPLMKALLAPTEHANGTDHSRHKRWKSFGKKGGGGGGGCCSSCGGCGGGGGGGGGGSWSKSSSSSSAGSWGGGGHGKKK